MTEKQKFIWISVGVCLTRMLDGWSTYLATPSLYLEVNPLVRKWGFGWWELIWAGTFFVTFVIAWFYISYRQLRLFDIKSPFAPAYLLSYFFGPPRWLPVWLWWLPKINNILIYLGLIIPRVLIPYSVFLIANNLVVWYNRATRDCDLCRQYIRTQSLDHDFYIIVTLTILFSLTLFWGKFRAHNKKNSDSPSE